jgi:copper transporter 1
MMHMTFYWGKNVTLLVDSWQTTSWTSYSLTLLTCFIISVFYQYLEDRRVRFKLISSAKAGNPTSQIDAPLLQGGAGKASRSKLFALRLAGAALFGFNSGIKPRNFFLFQSHGSLSILFFFSLSHSHLLSLTEN